MEPIESKITSQGQVSIPARIRRTLGLTPGSTVEWCERGEEVVVRRASKYSSLDVHKAVFSSPPARRSLEDLDEGIRSRMRRTHARS
jgi:AbrB family looped-hinge helix DNA binding protein